MYAIIRAEKLKSIGQVARSARHTYREQPTLNADGANTANNRFAGSRCTKDLLSALSSRLPVTRRKDAVLCIEYLITASPEAFSRHGGHLDDLGSGYFADALAWLRTRHGQENVVSAAVHLDETTPHLVAYVVPLTASGRLSARDFLGGPKVMRAMQDSFYESCGSLHGLLRGVKGSKAKHTDIANFYTSLNELAPAETLSALDYAAKAVGYETDAWKEANRQAKTMAQQATASALQKKALHSRIQTVSITDEQVKLKSLHVKQCAQAQAKRDLSLGRREQVLAKREPELELAIARAEAAERLLALYVERSNNTPERTLKKARSLTPTV